MEKHLTIQDLRAKINSLPRVKLATLPTPLHELPRLSRAIGAPRIFMKRDDLTGLAFGGNKTRMFEFLLAQALQEGADTIIGGAGVQSNYTRQLAAACRALGLNVYLVLRRIRGRKDDAVQGNLFLDLLAGARVRIMDATAEEQADAMYALAEELKKEGKKPYVVRLAQRKDLSPDVAAYAECFCESVEQWNALGIEPTHLYCSSYDSTQAGLELGKAALGKDLRIMGIAPANWTHGVADVIAGYANQAASKIGLSVTVDEKDVFNTEDYVGKGYGFLTPEAVEMIKLVARIEGIYLDPLYTSKAMAALRDHVEKGILTKDHTVVFLHTGGTPALFSYVDELDPLELRTYLSQ
jgi:1-aminocyclopropane-1-carboxylate deaminase/D-cysteine desulfhydrase-like pyridoxal-dependent ACC family enzyme